MKKRNIVSLTAMVCASMLLFSGCTAKTLTVGINQFAPHPSLDNCVEGFKQGLAEEGFEEGKNITIDLQNAQADGTKANSIAASFVSKNYALICGVATPSAQASFNASAGKVPVVFSAVTDPVAAKIVAGLDSTGGNITGTSDELPVDAQLQMIRAFLPEAKKIGILFTTSEVNSSVMLEKYTELAPNYGFEIVTRGVNTSTDIPVAADALIAEVDCLTNLLDNTIVTSLPIIIEKANAAAVPVFGSEEEQLKSGCIAAQSLDYVALGRETGKMAAQILRGADASTIPVYVAKAEDCEPVVNLKAAELLGIGIPADYADAKQVETE